MIVPIQGFSDFSVKVQMMVSVTVIRVSVYRKHGLIISFKMSKQIMGLLK